MKIMSTYRTLAQTNVGLSLHVIVKVCAGCYLWTIMLKISVRIKKGLSLTKPNKRI